MDNRSNTIAGWILGAGIVALGATIVTGEYFHGKDVESCESNDGYCPDYVAEAATATTGPGEPEQPIAFYLATADATRGEAAFRQCIACHSIAQGGPQGIGPNLYNVMGGPIAGKAGFGYSSALSGIGGNWDWDNMSEWLLSPKRFASGTAMNFAGIKDGQRRADLLLYLNQNASSPLAVPPPPPPISEDQAEAEDAAAEGDLQPAEDSGVLEEGTGDVVEAADGGVDVPEDE